MPANSCAPSCCRRLTLCVRSGSQCLWSLISMKKTNGQNHQLCKGDNKQQPLPSTAASAVASAAIDQWRLVAALLVHQRHGRRCSGTRNYSHAASIVGRRAVCCPACCCRLLLQPPQTYMHTGVGVVQADSGIAGSSMHCSRTACQLYCFVLVCCALQPGGFVI